MSNEIESLKFFQDRVELAGPNGSQVDRVKCNDRTVAVVRKWLSLNQALKAARAETMQTLEARPGKGDSVSLMVMDRERFDRLQETIKAQSEQILALGTAIMRLDEMGPDLWFARLEFHTGNCGRVEFGENQRLNNISAAILQRKANSGKTSAQILAEDEEYQKFKCLADEAIKQATEQLKTLRPQLTQVTSILESVSC